jgi:hypothetical protein
MAEVDAMNLLVLFPCNNVGKSILQENALPPKLDEEMLKDTKTVTRKRNSKMDRQKL